MTDPATAYLVASVCLFGLKLAVKGLKGLFKWIRRWLARKLKLKLYLTMVEQDRELQTRQLADRLRQNPKAWNKAQSYALSVAKHAGAKTLEDVDDEHLDESDLDAGSEWDGESCAGSEVPDSDFDLGSDGEGEEPGSPFQSSSDEEYASDSPDFDSDSD